MSSSPSSSQHKLPIYSSAGSPIQVVETHTALEQHVGEARRAVVDSTQHLREAVHSTVSRWINIERRVERRVLEIVPRDEPLTPNVLYVGVATLAGSVFGRYRSLPIRLVSPPLFFLASLNYFLPKTSHNLSQYYLELESRHLPSSVQSTRQEASASLRNLWNKGEQGVRSAADKAEGGWKEGLSRVQKETGLKIAEAEKEAKKNL